jgi:hypothetical protein
VSADDRSTDALKGLQLARHKLRLLLTVSALTLAAPAFAATTPPPPPDSPGATPDFSITVPQDIDAEGSNVDADTLKEIIGGGFAAHAQELAHLNATHIHIPEVRVNVHMARMVDTTGKPRGPVDFLYTYKDLDLDSVVDGTAKSVTLGELDIVGENNTTLKLGKMSISQVNYQAMLGFYGMAPDASDTFQTAYTDAKLDGGTVTSDELNCTIGSATLGEAKVKPMKVSFGELMTLVNSPEFSGTAQPSPASLKKLFDFYAELFADFQTTPMVLSSLDCTATDKKAADQVYKFKTGPLTIGAFGNMRYPSLEVQNLSVTAPDGTFALADAKWKSFDLSDTFAKLQSAPSLTKEWFTANARNLIPPFEGFSVAGLALDVPDSQHAGERIKIGLADFDLTLGKWLAGIPTAIDTSAHHFTMDVPSAGADAQMQQLRDLGITKLDLGADIKTHRDPDSKTIVIDTISVNGAQLGTIALAGVIGNAADELFSLDNTSALGAAMALTVKSLKLDFTDAGITTIGLTRFGAAQNMDLATTRGALSGMAQGAVIAALGAEAQPVGDAINKLIGGAGKNLSITVTAKDPNGLSLPDFMAAQQDPKAMVSKVTIDATSN